MLIGKQTPLNDTLREVLSTFVPGAQQVSPEEFILNGHVLANNKQVVFINLSGLTDQENTILNEIKRTPHSPKLVGIHTFMVPAMIDEILQKGYDAYLSFFEFSEKIEDLLESLGISILK